MRSRLRKTFGWLLTLKGCAVLLALLGVLSFLPQDLQGQTGALQAFQALGTGGDDVAAPSIVIQIVTLVGLALMPYFVMLLTSFIKVVVVLSLLRSALGVQQSPPNTVLTGIALLVTLYVMFPVAHAVYEEAKVVIDEAPTDLISKDSALFVMRVADAGKEPFRDFLVRNTEPKHQKAFLRIAQKTFPEPVKSTIELNNFIIIIPSYITSQLQDAFEIGVLVYLPFFVIDLVTSNILLAMGMMMLSPMTIALPIKLLLIVMLDGWTLLVQSLILTFN